MDKIKILAIVKHTGCYGESYHYVLNRPLEKKYTKIDNETIIGYDEGALSFYKRERCSEHWKAFGGSEFDLPLTDGSTEHCYGQWWDGMSDSAKELYNPDNLQHFAWGTKEELKRCYVYIGGECERKWLEELKKDYKGKIYDYWEYEKMIKSDEH